MYYLLYTNKLKKKLCNFYLQIFFKKQSGIGMNLDDLRYARRGESLALVEEKDIPLISTIDIRSKKKEKALLLLHGFTSTPAVFRTLIPALSFYDAIYAPVLPGHASSLADFAQTKSGAWLQKAEESALNLLGEYKKLDVMGLSLGGLLAVYLSEKFPLNHLYLLAPALELELSVKRYLSLLYCLNKLGFSEIRGFAGNLYTNTETEIAYRQLPIKSVIELFEMIDNVQGNFPPIKCPTDIFFGCHDHVVASLNIAERLEKEANITIHWLLNSAHVIPLDGDNEVIIKVLKEQNT